VFERWEKNVTSFSGTKLGQPFLSGVCSTRQDIFVYSFKNIGK
jgi:hypothetical protein